MSKITHVKIRMYRLGTGDCFILKFFTSGLMGETEKYTMMIDGGTWQGSKEKLTPIVEELKAYVKNHVDLLVITHEHKDHVHLFDVCKDQFTTDFHVGRIWMGWTENDQRASVKKWQQQYGDKKRALVTSVQKLKAALDDPAYKSSMEEGYSGQTILESRRAYVNALSEFSDLQSAVENGAYVGGLAGMQTVKKDIAKNNIEYYGPGDIIESPEIEGIKFYVLGPPRSWEEVSKETGGKGESYDHNKVLAGSDAFAAAVACDSGIPDTVLPFGKEYEIQDDRLSSICAYNSIGEDWRKIDYDWLYSAGSLALRINSATNNLSLALAIEFKDSGRVMLFPGDAEFGSWESWHKIDWNMSPRGKNKKAHYTQDLLNRTVFYKVAHHLSHNGTAARQGMEMMTHPDLVAMATLDYDIISKNWKNTMPNRALLKALVKQTKGRLIVMNDKDLYYNSENTVLLKNKIEQERKKMSAKELKEFNDSFSDQHEHYFEYTVRCQ